MSVIGLNVPALCVDQGHQATTERHLGAMFKSGCQTMAPTKWHLSTNLAPCSGCQTIMAPSYMVPYGLAPVGSSAMGAKWHPVFWHPVDGVLFGTIWGVVLGQRFGTQQRSDFDTIRFICIMSA